MSVQIIIIIMMQGQSLNHKSQLNLSLLAGFLYNWERRKEGSLSMWY